MKHYQITFEYIDNLSHGRWRSQSCTLYAADREDAIERTRRLYGLGVDCQYHITEVVDLDKEGTDFIRLY